MIPSALLSQKNKIPHHQPKLFTETHLHVSTLKLQKPLYIFGDDDYLNSINRYMSN